MAPRDRGKKGRKEYSNTRKERDRKERSENRRERIAQERAAEAAKPKRGSAEELADRAKRQAQFERDKKDSQPKEKGVWDNVKSSVNDFFSGKEDKGGFSPMGGPSSYGTSKKTFDDTVGRRRHEARSLDQRISRQVDYFKEAPVDYISDLLDNPMVSGAVMMSGLGIPALGVKVLDAGMDYLQNEASPMEALANVGYGTLSYSPVGAALPGPLRGIAKAGLKSGAKGAAMAGSGFVGGKLGTNVGEQLASVFTDNPMAKAGVIAASAAAGSFGASKATEIAMAQPSQGPVSGMKPPREGQGERRQSPLVTSGEKAVESSQRLMEQTEPVDLYAQTVKSLPYYGLSPELTGQQQQYYGV